MLISFLLLNKIRKNFSKGAYLLFLKVIRKGESRVFRSFDIQMKVVQIPRNYLLFVKLLLVSLGLVNIVVIPHLKSRLIEIY